MSQHLVDTLVSYVVLVGLLGFVGGKVFGGSPFFAKLFRSTLLLGIGAVVFSTLLGLLRQGTATVRTSLAAPDPVGTAEAAALVVAALGHLALAAHLIRRRLSRGSAEARQRDADTARRRGRAVLPDRLEGQ